MNAEQDQAPPRLVISSGGDEARLHLPATLPRGQITRGMLEVLARDQDLELTPATCEAIRDLLADLPPEGQDAEVVLARATEPVHGKDGWVEWLVEEPHEQPTDLSFYERSPFVMVEQGQRIGRLHEPTLGEDGRDVTGKTRAAKPGKDASWKFDDSILVDARNDLIAQCQGMLVRADGKAYVTKVLHVDDAVDFSTGHINFAGDVVVGGGVCDRFEVKASGAVEVRGLIEAAYVQSGDKLVALGGLAAREQGWIDIQGDLLARHLNGAIGRVVGNLRAEREVINCQLEIDGDLQIASGALIGGAIRLGGRVSAPIFGSPGHVATHLQLGTVPGLARDLAHLEMLIEASAARHEEATEELTNVNRQRHLDAAQRERQTELMYEQQTLATAIETAEAGRAHLQRRLRERRDVELTAVRAIYPNVRLKFDSATYRLHTELRGPVRITEQGDGPVYRTGDGPARPLQEIARVVTEEEACTESSKRNVA